ncbi:ABC-type glycerol-3-phosphate transport system substrate-binding protein [Streptacidiphilus sp. MAP12-33]|uniref:chaplin n=1 Tax=Streptacidiphilus sp. MAP12-33 TaxID=3156266 RepID=UPI0035155900
MRMPSRLAAAGVLAAGLVLAACGMASADANANGVVSGSPGFLSGNLVQVPVDADVNLCGNTVNVVGLLNPAFGNRCANGEEDSGGHTVVWHHHWWHHDVDDVAAPDQDQDCD